MAEEFCNIRMWIMYKVGICGGSCSGKTEFTRALHERLSDISGILSQDSYYRDWSNLTFDEREKINYDHQTAIEWTLMLSHIGDLESGKSVPVPVYDFSTHTRTSKTLSFTPPKILLIDGHLIFAVPELFVKLDRAIFVYAHADVRFDRRLQRDVRERGRSEDSVRKQWHETVAPMHRQFVEPFMLNAHIIIPNGGQDSQNANMVADFFRRVIGV